MGCFCCWTGQSNWSKEATLQSDLLLLVVLFWLVSFALALIVRHDWPARAVLVAGCALGLAYCVLGWTRPPLTSSLHFSLADTPVEFQLDNAGLWLLFFGLVPALFAAGLTTASASTPSKRYWLAGLAATLLGALGVFGLQDTMSFLIAWEIMSIGGAVMILGERLSPEPGGPILFMLSLLEVGAVAVLLALLLLANHIPSQSFQRFVTSYATSSPSTFLIGLLFLFGFGAKLGIIPFYEWFPAAYASGSGATGVVFSGVVMNAAFYALGRATLQWLPHAGTWAIGTASIMVVSGVLSAILAIFYAFQEEDWRRLLSFSSAENATVAIAVLGVSALFFSSSLSAFASLAWTVALLHLAAHSLAKGTLFLTSDGIHEVNGDYWIRQTGLLRRSPMIYGIGALFAAMSLAALPPQAGFATEWYIFQTLFQGTQVNNLVARLTIALAAAGLALVAAVALATFVKLFGVGLLGDGHAGPTHLSPFRSSCVFIVGMCVLGLAAGMPWWLRFLGQTNQSIFGVDAAATMRNGWLLVPLSGKFAFISPTKLVIAGPLLALIPLMLFWTSRQAYRLRRVPVWSGGRREDARRIATTSLAFSNALRTFYSFVYGPTHNIEREYQESPYFVKRLIFNQEVAPVFGPYLFAPLTRFVRKLSVKVSALQSGYLNSYNAMIGILLVLILALSLFYK
jgi:formate hydrogenlyase subunit 3/multisubunit Na+/H+ antiporter MnhD subunit